MIFLKDWNWRINQRVPAKSAKKGAKEKVKNQANTNTSVKEIPFYG